MRCEIWDKVKDENGWLINLVSITTLNTKVSLISLTNMSKAIKSFTLLNITIVSKEKQDV